MDLQDVSELSQSQDEISEPRPRRTTSRTDLLSRGALPIVTVGLFVLFSVLLPDTFPTRTNITIMLTTTSVLLILALALTIPLRSGDFDLSIGAVTGLSAVVVGVLTTQHGVPVPLAMLMALGVGLTVGAINGAVIVLIGVNAFITTLGMLTVLAGVSLAVSDSSLIINLPSSLQSFSRANFLGLPMAVWYGWILAAFLYYLYEYTPVGKYLLFVGGNRDAAALSGLRVKPIRFLAFVASGVLSAFAGVVVAGNLGAVDPSIGPAYLLPPYAAAFLGTTTIAIGRFNVIGTIVGLYFITIGITGLQLAGAEPWIALVFNGGMLIVAIVFANLSERLVNRRSAANALHN
jgi:ribose transport system permease protein